MSVQLQLVLKPLNSIVACRARFFISSVCLGLARLGLAWLGLALTCFDTASSLSLSYLHHAKSQAEPHYNPSRVKARPSQAKPKAEPHQTQAKASRAPPKTQPHLRKSQLAAPHLSVFSTKRIRRWPAVTDDDVSGDP